MSSLWVGEGRTFIEHLWRTRLCYGQPISFILINPHNLCLSLSELDVIISIQRAEGSGALLVAQKRLWGWEVTGKPNRHRCVVYRIYNHRDLCLGLGWEALSTSLLGVLPGTGLFSLYLAIAVLHAPPSIGPLSISTSASQRHSPAEHQNIIFNQRWEDWLSSEHFWNCPEIQTFCEARGSLRKFLSSPQGWVSEVSTFLPGPKEMLEVLWKSLTPF